MEENQHGVSSAPRTGANPYVLPASILIAAVLVSGSIVYLVRSGGLGKSEPGVKKYPKTAFTECVETRKYQEQVKADYTAATAVGVQGTPTLFVNGNKVERWDTELGKAIDDALAGKVKPSTDEAFRVKERDVILGDANAPVTVIEYGDYQCPWCARFYVNVEPTIRENYIKTGKAKMIFRNFQFLSQESVDAAEAAECAKDQGKFWEFHDKIYDAEHADGVEHNKNLTKDLFFSIAEEIGLMKK